VRVRVQLHFTVVIDADAQAVRVRLRLRCALTLRRWSARELDADGARVLFLYFATARAQTPNFKVKLHVNFKFKRNLFRPSHASPLQRRKVVP